MFDHWDIDTSLFKQGMLAWTDLFQVLITIRTWWTLLGHTIVHVCTCMYLSLSIHKFEQSLFIYGDLLLQVLLLQELLYKQIMKTNDYWNPCASNPYPIKVPLHFLALACATLGDILILTWSSNLLVEKQIKLRKHHLYLYMSFNWIFLTFVNESVRFHTVVRGLRVSNNIINETNACTQMKLK